MATLFCVPTAAACIATRSTSRRHRRRRSCNVAGAPRFPGCERMWQSQAPQSLWWSPAACHLRKSVSHTSRSLCGRLRATLSPSTSRILTRLPWSKPRSRQRMESTKRAAFHVRKQRSGRWPHGIRLQRSKGRDTSLDTPSSRWQLNQ